MTLGSYRTGSGLRVSQLLERFGQKAVDSMGRGLYREGQGILAESQELVPVDTGALRSSGYVTEPEREGDTVTVTIGYGGPAAKVNPKTGESVEGYAIFVHENLEAHHNVGMAKYLELPFVQAQNGMGSRLADFMEQDLGANVALGHSGPEVDYGDVVQ